MTSTLTVDDLTFEVRWSQRRRTLGLTVDRHGELVLAAPEGASTEAMRRFVRDKQFWVYKKLAQKGALTHDRTDKEYVTGEGFPYLGKSYRLLLVDEQEVPLKLDHGRFKLLRTEAGRGRDHFVRWYADHARRWLSRKVRSLARRVGVGPAGIEVRDLGYRWGSCGKAGTLNFHWAAILLPPHIVEYVVVHELVHLREPHHTPDFWRRVERAMPDHEVRRRWLAEHGAALVTVYASTPPSSGSHSRFEGPRIG